MTQFPFMSLFSHSFHAIADILFLILSCLCASVVAKSKWKIHLNWLVPFIAENVLTLLYRTFINVHYFFGLHWTYRIYSWIYTLNYTAGVVGLYGSIVLLQTLKTLVKQNSERDALAAAAQEEPGVWPPAPKTPSSD